MAAHAQENKFDFHKLKSSIQKLIGTANLTEVSAISQFQKVLATSPGSDSEKLTCVDLSLRDQLKDIIKNGGDIQDAVPLLDFTLQIIPKVGRFVGLKVNAEESCPLGTIFSMLMDLADCSTISQCEDLFTYVEGKMGKFKSEPFFAKGKNHLLRMCNDILKKLSKSQNTVFCGRIQLFLAGLFPLTEKSGLNLLSEFNLDNLTIFGSSPPSVDTVELPPAKQDEQMDTEEFGLSLAKEAPVDYNFYTKFWSLQDFFREPTQCYNKVLWKKFSTYTDSVLDRFKSLKLDDAKMMSQRQKLKYVKSVRDRHTFFAKYLTSDKLFNLQLSDGNFRRYVLVQFLILHQYLTSQVKFRVSSLALTEEQTKWLAKLRKNVLELISETPPNGPAFAETVERVLEMESSWNSWKNEQCPSFVKRSDPKEQRTRIIVRKRSMVDDLNITDPKMINLGNNELNRLWNLHADNEAIIRSEKRQFVPAIEQYFEDAIMAADPANQIEDSYKDVHKPGWQWRALRLLSKKSRHLFEQTQTPARKIPDYLEDIMRKLAKEITPTGDSGGSNQEEEVSLQTGQANEEEIDVETEEVLNNTAGENDTSKPGTTPVADISQSNIANNDDIMETTQTLLCSLVSNDHINSIADHVADKWEKLATEFTELDQDDLNYFKDKETPLLQASNMLTVWKEMLNNKATVEKMSSALKAAGMSEVAIKVFGPSVYS